jgi:hypothetical protein
MARFLVDMEVENLFGFVVMDKVDAMRLLGYKNVFDKASALLDGKACRLNLFDDLMGKGRRMVEFFEACPNDIHDLVRRIDRAEDCVAIPDDRAADFSVMPRLLRDSDGDGELHDELEVTEDGICWLASLDKYDHFVRTCEVPWDSIRAIAFAGCQEPSNNDGRAQCWWCGVKTRKIVLLSDETDFCDACGK